MKTSVERIVDLAMEANNSKKIIYVAPWYETRLFEVNERNTKKFKSAFTLTGLELLTKKFGDIKRRVAVHQSELCGMDIDLLPNDPEEFVKELLLPDYTSKAVRANKDMMALCDELRSEHVNVAMAYMLCKYISKTVISYDVYRAPCFLRCPHDAYDDVSDVSELVRKLATDGYLLRRDV